MIEQVDVDLKFRKENGESCLHYAAHNGHKECLEILIEHGAEINAFTRFVNFF